MPKAMTLLPREQQDSHLKRAAIMDTTSSDHEQARDFEDEETAVLDEEVDNGSAPSNQQGVVSSNTNKVSGSEVAVVKQPNDHDALAGRGNKSTHPHVANLYHRHLQVVTQPHDHDVLMGRSRNNTKRNHPGTLYYRYLCKTHLQAYLMSPYSSKVDVVRQIIRIITCQSPPGRFIEMKNGQWLVVPKKEVVERTKQVMRDVPRSQSFSTSIMMLQKSVTGRILQLQQYLSFSNNRNNRIDGGNVNWILPGPPQAAPPLLCRQASSYEYFPAVEAQFCAALAPRCTIASEQGHLTYRERRRGMQVSPAPLTALISQQARHEPTVNADFSPRERMMVTTMAEEQEQDNQSVDMKESDQFDDAVEEQQKQDDNVSTSLQIYHACMRFGYLDDELVRRRRR